MTRLLSRTHRPRLWPVLLAVLLALTALWWFWPQPAGGTLVVYGATPQGVMAAVTASRQGEQVTLIEPGPGVGGVLTQGWLATLDVSADRQGRPYAQGLFREVYRKLGHDNSFDVLRAQQVLDAMLRASGVRVLLGTRAAQLQVRAGRVRGLQVSGPAGTAWLRPAQVIDASDTAELAARAGAQFTVGRSDTGLGSAQMAATLVFRVTGVNRAALARRVRQERGHEDGRRGRSLSGLVGITSGYVPSDAARFHLRGFNSAFQDDGSLLVNALLIYGVDGTSPAAVARARQDGAREAARVVRYLRRALPTAFGHAALGGVAPQLYLRETRHLVGDTRLNAADVLYGRPAQGGVAVNAYPLDGQAYVPGESPFLIGTPQPYQVPFSALRPRGWDNLLVVSQAASFDSVAAFSARVVPLQMSLGEAAGQASVLAWRLHLGYGAFSGAGLAPRLLQFALRVHHARLSAGPVRLERPCGDAAQPGWKEAEKLLKSGLMSAPYYYVGCLYLNEPERLGTFLGDLRHAGLMSGTPEPADAPTDRLTAGRARQVLRALGVSVPPTLRDTPDGQVLRRGEAAALRWAVGTPPRLFSPLHVIFIRTAGTRPCGLRNVPSGAAKRGQPRCSGQEADTAHCAPPGLAGPAGDVPGVTELDGSPHHRDSGHSVLHYLNDQGRRNKEQNGFRERSENHGAVPFF